MIQLLCFVFTKKKLCIWRKQYWTLSHLQQVCTLTIFRIRLYPRIFNSVCGAQSLVLCVVFCRLLYTLFHFFSLVIVFSHLHRYTAYGCCFGIFTLYLKKLPTFTCNHTPVEFHKQLKCYLNQIIYLSTMNIFSIDTYDIMLFCFGNCD